MINLAKLENYNTNVISIGINMKCNEVITKSVLYKKDGRWCVKNGGLHMYCIDLRDSINKNFKFKKLLMLFFILFALINILQYITYIQYIQALFNIYNIRPDLDSVIGKKLSSVIHRLSD